jgi:hypothetical protein
VERQKKADAESKIAAIKAQMEALGVWSLEFRV